MQSSTATDGHQGNTEITADLQYVAHLVHEEFDDRLDAQAIDECLATVAASFNDATVRSFVPLLVRRYVGEELRARLDHDCLM